MNKPVLYHASPQRIQNNTLTPRHQHTCAYSQYAGTPEQTQHEGEFVFAGPDPNIAYAYALKLSHPTETELHLGKSRPYEFMLSAGVYPDIPTSSGPKTVPIAIISQGEEFEKLLPQAQPTVYEIPAKNSFEQVMNKDGSASGEWISRTPVDITHAKKLAVRGVDEAMRHGVQIFYLDPSYSKDEWYDISQRSAERMEQLIARRHAEGTPEFKKEFTHYCLDFLHQCVETGVLQHINRERNIEPLDLTSSLDQSLNWSDVIKRHSRGNPRSHQPRQPPAMEKTLV